MNSFKNVLIIILLVLVGGLIGYIIYDKVNDKNSTSNTAISDNSDINNTKEDYAIIKVLGIDNVEVGSNLINHPMYVTIKMNMDYDEKIVRGVTLSGYCEDEENSKYNIHGPGSGANFFYKDSGEYKLVNSVDINGNSEVFLSDGKRKENIDWDSVKIKSCTIESAIIYSMDDSVTKLGTISLNYKQSIN